MENTSAYYTKPDNAIFGFVSVKVFFVIGPHTFMSFYDGLNFILRRTFPNAMIYYRFWIIDYFPSQKFHSVAYIHVFAVHKKIFIKEAYCF